MSTKDFKDWQTRKKTDDQILKTAVNELLNIEETILQTDVSQNKLLLALKIVAKKIGIEPNSVKEPENFFGVDDENLGFNDLIVHATQISENSRMGVRKVTLKGDWHSFDSGVLLTFSQKSGEPVVLLPESDGSYVAQEIGSGRKIKVTKENKEDFFRTALSFYKLFPQTKIKVWDILKFSRHFYKLSYVFIFFGAMIFSSMMSMVTPVISGKIFGEVVPNSDAQLLIIIGITLFTLAIGTSLMGLVKGLAMTNIENNADMGIHAAIIERVFAMPDSFFKKYSSGELLARLGDINTIRKTLTGTGITILSATFTMLFNAVLLFYYGGILAWIVFLSSLIYSIFIVLISLRQMHFYKQHLVIGSELSSRLLQIISNIAKIKVMRAEKRIFRFWSELLAKQIGLDIKEMNLGIVSSISLMFVQVATNIIIYYYIVDKIGQRDAMALPQFIAFTAAYGTFSGSFSAIVGSLSGLLHVIPVYKRITPLLETIPENSNQNGKNIILEGNIKAEQLQFSYTTESGQKQLIIDDVSFEIKKGEFVAIVGSSGSGKTTLVKLLLGFLPIDKGVIYYDGVELSTLDIKCIRRQCGSVLQTGQLLPGTIFQNIVGVYNYSMEDAWQAAAFAEVADDIMKMPMQMFTMIAEGAVTISGGQRQRLLIARALVKRPKIIIFDEATSALDNISQAKLMRSVEKLPVTKLVIAHRISTIKNADKIIVLEKGKVVECGKFEELLVKGGQFSKLAKQQSLS